MKLIELIIDEEMELSGIDAISIVESPAIEEDFIALNTEQKDYKFAEVDKEKKIIMGAMLVPDKPIYRNDEKEGEYYIYFSKETIRRCMELFFQNGNQSNATFEHMESITGLTMVESWIVEDTEKDKSNFYNLNVPVGTWCGTIKVNNDVIWNDFIKTGKVKGFSIEGYFADKAKTPLSKVDEVDLEIEAGLELLSIKYYIEDREKKIILENYNDYPKEATENAKVALRYAEENGCGRLMWLCWGRDAGIEWASNKLKQIRNAKK